MIEQAKLTYSKNKTIKDQGEKHIETIQDNKKQLANIQKLTIIIPEDILSDEAKKEQVI